MKENKEFEMITFLNEEICYKIYIYTPIFLYLLEMAGISIWEKIEADWRDEDMRHCCGYR